MNTVQLLQLSLLLITTSTAFAPITIYCFPPQSSDPSWVKHGLCYKDFPDGTFLVYTCNQDCKGDVHGCTPHEDFTATCY
ncbi:unnamed protein product [Zymoseptoria tritici ST99CH_1A5]|nr:unnamed protein product [Zymoseptoria tritici ST99CH_1E4]SMR43724.1 unnamed protein product [Zymoseptoria tritici ST99CH_3D1]SMY18883.1 unnamed protein product [Zymoseptoria tritici ST99CH_1A5]